MTARLPTCGLPWARASRLRTRTGWKLPAGARSFRTRAGHGSRCRAWLRSCQPLLDLLHRVAGDQDAVGADQRHRVQALHVARSEEHTSELQSIMRISYAVFCLKKKKLN